MRSIDRLCVGIVSVQSEGYGLRGYRRGYKDGMLEMFEVVGSRFGVAVSLEVEIFPLDFGACASTPHL